LAVNVKTNYLKYKILKGSHAGQTIILASERVLDSFAYSGIFASNVESKNGEIPIEWASRLDILGSNLLGLEYEPLYNVKIKKTKKHIILFPVICDDY
jgi:hypothetical protein